MEEEQEGSVTQEHVFGIPVPDMDEGIQPLECLILIKGINMEDGSPTMTSIGSSGITPWEAVGMMDMEIEHMKFMTIYASMRALEEGDE